VFFSVLDAVFGFQYERRKGLLMLDEPNVKVGSINLVGTAEAGGAQPS
jgi:hypothetical protein